MIIKFAKFQPRVDGQYFKFGYLVLREYVTLQNAECQLFVLVKVNLRISFTIQSESVELFHWNIKILVRKELSA